MAQGAIAMKGMLSIKPNLAQKTDWEWRLRNTLRWSYIYGTFRNMFARFLGKTLGYHIPIAELKAVLHQKDGTRINYGVLSRMVVTDAFVEFQVDNMVADTTEWGDFKFHDSGVGVTGENVTDTDMETTDGESRATGTQLEGASAEIYRTVGTIAYTTTKAITEHGVFSIAAAGTLLDRSTFAAINVVNGDSIEFTYELTVTAGG